MSNNLKSRIKEAIYAYCKELAGRIAGELTIRELTVTHRLTSRQMATILAWDENFDNVIWNDPLGRIEETLREFGCEVFETIRSEVFETIRSDDRSPEGYHVDRIEKKLIEEYLL